MSNCIVQAVKYKILHGCNVYYVKPFKKEGLPHFCWWDSKMGSYRHYTFDGKKPKWYKLLWFRGHEDNFPYEKMKIKLIRVL